MAWQLLHLSAFFCLAMVAAADETAPQNKRPIFLDCAIGSDIDDAFALALATADPTLDLRGVTTVSGDTEVRAWMVCRFLSAIDRTDVPVAFGRSKQPASEIGAQFQYRYHPAVLFGRTAKPAKQTAAELLRERLADDQRKTTIVCAGPLTNIAQLLADDPDAKKHIERVIVSAAKENLKLDPAAAKAVFESQIPLLVIPEETASEVRFDDGRLRSIFAACTPRTMQLQTLYELWQGKKAVLTDAVAAALASDDDRLRRVFSYMPMVARIDEGRLALAEGPSHIQIVKDVKTQPLLDWLTGQLTQGEPILPREPSNRTAPIERGGTPNRVHVFEDYETDIERRWWLAGIAQKESVPRGSTRACRGMLTMDFDDLQGDTKTIYRAVVFNPVPGPPMGKSPRLAFRCRLKGTDKLRVQIYSLSSGYHRYLSLAELPQDRWLDLAVDMTQARRHDGSGGPLSEGERIDDIQFYVDPRADLFVDDIVLYDAAAADEQRPFPKRLHFTGWFDTGKQGQEWPGMFEIPADSGYFWKAARSVPNADSKRPWIRIGLRGSRPLAPAVQLDFRYKLSKAGPLDIALRDSTSGRELRTELKALKADGWQQASVTLRPAETTGEPRRQAQEFSRADELHFMLAGDGELLLDDLLLYEPAAGKR